MKAAVIGLGRVGYDFGVDKNRLQPASHFHCYKQLGAEIALCDSDSLKLQTVILTEDMHANKLTEQQILQGYQATGHYYTDYKEMLQNFKPEIVSICTPTSTHKDIALAAASCPSVKTIFLEKPIAQSLAEADEIIRACEQNNKRLAINYSRRWSKVYLAVKQELPPVNIVGVHPGPLIRTGTHMIDLFNWIVNPPYPNIGTTEDLWNSFEVQAFGDAALSSYMSETDDFNINGYIKYGVFGQAVLLGNLESVPQNAVVFEITTWTEKADFKVTENGCRTEYFSLSGSKRYANLNEYRRNFTGENEPENLLLNAITQLVDTLNSRNSVSYISANCRGIDARRTLQVALALHYSATHGNIIVKLSEVPYDYTVRSY